MFDQEKIELFHGSSVEFEEFNNNSIKHGNVAQIISGIYFTTNPAEAINYAINYKDKNEVEGGYIYQVDIDYNYSRGGRKDKLELLADLALPKNKRFVEISKTNDGFKIVNDSGVNLTVKKIADLIVKSTNYKMQITNFSDGLDFNLNDKNQLKNLVYKTANHYYQYYKSNGLVNWINAFSNDFFNNDEDLLKFNKFLSKSLNLAGFVRDDITQKLPIKDKKEFHIVFLDPNDVPKPTIRTIGNPKVLSGKTYDDFSEYQKKQLEENKRVENEQKAYDYFIKSVSAKNLSENYNLLEESKVESYANYLKQVKENNEKPENKIKLIVLQEWLFSFLKQYQIQKDKILFDENLLAKITKEKYLNSSLKQNKKSKERFNKQDVIVNVFKGVYSALSKANEIYLENSSIEINNEWNELLNNNLSDRIFKEVQTKYEDELVVNKEIALIFISDILERDSSIVLNEENVNNLFNRYESMMNVRHPNYVDYGLKLDREEFAFVFKLAKKEQEINDFSDKEITGFKKLILIKELNNKSQDIFEQLSIDFDLQEHEIDWIEFVNKNFDEAYQKVREKFEIKQNLNIYQTPQKNIKNTI